jgi:MSHA biogenesis protein MshM
LRLLCNLEANGDKAVQVVLAAQPAVQRVLSRRELASFRQRLAIRVRVEPLGMEEAMDYLLHHLRAAGGQPETLTTEEALELLARGTRGVPRLLNQAGHQALMLAAEMQAEVVDAEVALEALGTLGLGGAEADHEVPGRMTAAETDGEDVAVPPLPELTPILVRRPGPVPETADMPEEAHDVLAYRLYEPPRQPA